MQLTRHTDYGLRILLYLALKPAAYVASIDEVTAAFSLSRNHVTKIVHKLAKAGFISSQRGNGGGIRLGRAADEIKLGDVVRLLETNLKPVDCHLPEECVLLPACRLKGVLAEAMGAFMRELDHYVLADMVDQQKAVSILRFQDLA